ncbi:MAG: STAS domain-containing protein [Alphaproteobacteria bacterium]|nr:STAS domain-containing protein [Alphaproteobacteria bacterium]
METTNKDLVIEQKHEGTKLTCTLSGWLDPNTSPKLIEQIDLAEIKELVFDMKNVEYVFSAGLRAFMIFQRIMDAQNGTIKLINVSDQVRSIFEYTGFESLLEPK